MKQHEVPRGTVATLGHPANGNLIVKGNAGWRHVETGMPVDEENFRGGWDIVSVPPPERPEGTFDMEAIAARYSLARMAGTYAVDAGRGWDEGTMRAFERSWQDVWTLYHAVRELIDAIRLTQDYVGPDTLPPIEGWSWYDAMVKYAPEVAEEARRVPTARHRAPTS